MVVRCIFRFASRFPSATDLDHTYSRVVVLVRVLACFVTAANGVVVISVGGDPVFLFLHSCPSLFFCISRGNEQDSDMVVGNKGTGLDEYPLCYAF